VVKSWAIEAAPGKSVTTTSTFAVAVRLFHRHGHSAARGKYLDNSDSHRQELSCVVERKLRPPLLARRQRSCQQIYRNSVIEAAIVH